jgi:drug/metabolite transporter (DMT)-like permease
MTTHPSPEPSSRLALSLLFFSATLWGLTWWPVKQFAEAGLSGPYLTLFSYGPVGLFGIWFLLRERAAWSGQGHMLLLLAFVGGWANAAFISALLQGEVVRVMLLFYLSPVWSVLGARLFLGEKISGKRSLAVCLALIGLWYVIGGSAAFEQALNASDLLALSAGLGFAGNNLISRATQSVPMTSKTVVVFIGCGVLSATTVLCQGAPMPTLSAPLSLGLLAYGFGWMVLATATWQYGVTHLETGRAGVILITELVVAVVSVTWFGPEQMLPHIWIGGLFIAAAAVMEAIDPGHASKPSMQKSPHFTTKESP